MSQTYDDESVVMVKGYVIQLEGLASNNVGSKCFLKLQHFYCTFKFLAGPLLFTLCSRQYCMLYTAVCCILY
jgi:hypothetical protein